MAQRFIAAQTDFGGGQVDEDANRREDAKVPKTGARRMENWRQRNTGVLDVRPGHSAICFGGSRVERFRMSAQQELIISFGTATGQTYGAVQILDKAGNVLATNASANYLWTTATVSKINWCTTPDRIVICFPGMRPQVILWNGASNGFTFQQFQFLTVGYQINEPFYRAPPTLGMTLTYSAYTGSIAITSSVPFFTNAMIGTVLSLGGAQCTITAVGSTTPITTCTAAVPTGASMLPRMFCVVDAFSAQSVSPLAIYPPNSIATTSVSKWLVEIGETYHLPGGDGFQWVVDFTVLSGPEAGGAVQYEGLVTQWGSFGLSPPGVLATRHRVVSSIPRMFSA